MRERVQDEVIEQTWQNIASDGYSDAKHRPFGLLALLGRRDRAIAVQLERYRTQDETEKERQAQHGAIKSQRRNAGDRAPVDEHEQSKPACPGWHVASIREYERAEQQATIAESADSRNEPRPADGKRLQGEICESERQHHQGKRGEDGDAGIRSAPEEQRSHTGIAE